MTTNSLFDSLYDDLRRIAAAVLRSESRPTWTPTVLLHEAYLRSAQADWQSPHQFVGMARWHMRQALIDRGRYWRAAKRQRAVNPPAAVQTTDGPARDALSRLSQIDPRLARLVELRYLEGYSIGEAADKLGISSAQARREWTCARAILRSCLERPC